MKKEDDDSNVSFSYTLNSTNFKKNIHFGLQEQNNSFFAETFADDDGWNNDQDDSEIYDDQRMENCRVVVESIKVNVKDQSPKRKTTTKRKPPAKRKSKVTAKRKKGGDDPESDVKVEVSPTLITESVEETPVDDLKPELDPVTGEIVMPPMAVNSQENKPNRKRDRTKGPKVKKEKKPYVRK